jgi:hypothetical protein
MEYVNQLKCICALPPDTHIHKWKAKGRGNYLPGATVTLLDLQKWEKGSLNISGCIYYISDSISRIRLGIPARRKGVGMGLKKTKGRGDGSGYVT